MAVSKAAPPPVVTAAPSLGPAVTTIRASEVEPEELTFLWLDRVPHGTLTLVGGRPGMGKSLFTNYLAAVVTRAGGAVLMSNPEDAMSTTKIPRLLAAGADPRLVHFWPGKISLPTDVPDLEELVLFHGIQLITIDPIAKHIRSKDPSTALEPLIGMAERTGVAVVGVHHLIKRLPKDAHPAEAFGGASGGWLGTTRVAHVFGPAEGGEEESRYLAFAKQNHAREGAPSVEFYLEEVEVDLPGDKVTEVGRLVYVGADAEKQDANAVVHFHGRGYKDAGGDPDKKAVAAEFLTLLLMNGAVPAKAVFEKAAEVGVSQKTTRRAAEQLEVVKERKGFGPGSFLVWSLPPGHPALRSVGPRVKTKTAAKLKADLDAEIAKILGGGGNV